MREEIKFSFFTADYSANGCFLLHTNSKLILTHLASVSVDQVEDGFILRLPSHGFVQTFSLDSVQHELQHVQLDWLLNKHNVVLRHDWRGRTHRTKCMQRTNNMIDKAYSYFIIYVIFSISYTVDLLHHGGIIHLKIHTTHVLRQGFSVFHNLRSTSDC